MRVRQPGSNFDASRAQSPIRRYYGDRARRYAWWFAALARHQTQVALRASGLHAGESLLDVGCGPAHYARSLRRRGHEVWGVDCCPEMIAVARQSLDRALVGDLQKLQLGRTFDVILCIGVLELLPDPIAALGRMKEHLADGGRLVVLVPCAGVFGRIYRLAHRRHGLPVRLFTPGELSALAGRAGFASSGRVSPFLHNFITVLEARCAC